MEQCLTDFSSLQCYLWAKTAPYKKLLPHMIDSGCCAKAYLEALSSSALLSYLSDQWNCSQKTVLEFVPYLVAMHDIGKATPQFQMQNEEQLVRLRETEIKQILPATIPNPVRHEYLSGRIARRIWKEQGESKRVYDAYACILSLHHQRPDLSDKQKPHIHDGWSQIQNWLEEHIREVFHFREKLPVARETDPVCLLLTGIQILCDWLASSSHFDSLAKITEDYYQKSLTIARETVRRCGLTEDHLFSAPDSFQAIFPQILNPRDIQKACETLDSSSLLTIIEAPMGEGKTEAALYLAVRKAQNRGKRGFYVALPTQATSNQMFGRFADMLEKTGEGHVRLLHGTAYLMKEGDETVQSDDADEAERWLGTSRMGLLDENGVGTVDQAMGAVLLARFSVLRMLGLSNKVLVIDEMHAYDAYMSEIIESLLYWCRALSIPVILLSATLQNSQRIKYLSCYTNAGTLPNLNNGYPLITQVLSDQSIVQTKTEATMKTNYLFRTEKLGQDEKAIASFAVEKIKNGGCYCILTNTVTRAQGVFRELQKLADPDIELFLFHARFTMEKRGEIEKTCLMKFGKNALSKRPVKAILVATQVVEQSLDIDFDGMISEIAPIDLLLQRSGRVHRHRNRTRPSGLETPAVHVIIPTEETDTDPVERYGLSGYVYAPFLLYNTEKLLGENLVISVPKDVRSVISRVYEYVSDENMKIWQERAFNQQLMRANADRVAFPIPAADYFFPAQSHPEFENMNVDDGFDPAARAATRLGEPTFRIAFVNGELLDAARESKLSREQQKQVLLSSVSLRLTPEIMNGLNNGEFFRIQKGALCGCYIVEQESVRQIGKKKLINDPILGVYWED